MLVFSLWKKLNEARSEKQVKKQARKRMQKRPTPILHEGTEEEKRYASETVTAPSDYTRRNTPKKETTGRSEVSAQRSRPRAHTPEKEEREIAFHTRSDARRAFIYSEIFRRKYE